MPYKVILADSSPSTQSAVQAAFQYPVFEVFICANGADVFETILRIRPDALLINLFLPGGDGRSLVHRIRGREEFKNLPVVFLRGNFEAFDIKEETSAGRIFVRKPFDSEKLALDVRDLIDGVLTPPTLPEEPDFSEDFSDKSVLENMLDQNSRGIPDLDHRIVDLIRREAIALEREVEKRLSARLFALLKRTPEQKPRTGPRRVRDAVDTSGDA